MNSLLGQAMVLVGLVACAAGAVVGFYAGYSRSAPALAWARRLAAVLLAAMAGAAAVMEWALISRDFSVSYVAQVGSHATPLLITIVSLWSSLEGSILLWGLVLAGFIAGLAYLQRDDRGDYLGYALGTAFAVGIFFCFLIAGPANPFQPVPPPVPVDGPGPNPLLQNHALMVIHPPMLYLGYVGMTIPFAMAVAALLRGQLGPTWLRPLRNWLLVPTAFLSLGIMLGGWWSYEVLGWGGYWAWDPVENASFLPWLTAVAAVHSAIVLDRRGTLKAWTVVLVLVTFLLTILGTFLTRSGVVNSVHSFTQSPIGPMFLVFLGICSAAVVVLLALRLSRLEAPSPQEALVSRESAFLVNNLLLVGFMFTVLVGTLFPIVAEAVRGVKVSVGEPYFNRLGVPICFALIATMGIGPALPWGSGDTRKVLRTLARPVPIALGVAVVAWLMGARNPSTLLASAIVGYVGWISLARMSEPTRVRARRGQGLTDAARESFRRSPRLVGAYVSHLGVLVTFLAIALSSTYQQSAEANLSPGETLSVDRYELRFENVESVQEPHRTSRRATVSVSRGSRPWRTLTPALNQYATQREPIGTPAVRTSWSHDLYLTLQSVSLDGSVGLRAIVTPAVVWIWIGVFLLVAGTALCLLPRRSAAS